MTIIDFRWGHSSALKEMAIIREILLTFKNDQNNVHDNDRHRNYSLHRCSYIKYLNETTKFSVGQPITKDLSGNFTLSATSSMHPAIHISASLTRSFNLKYDEDLREENATMFLRHIVIVFQRLPQ